MPMRGRRVKRAARPRACLCKSGCAGGGARCSRNLPEPHACARKCHDQEIWLVRGISARCTEDSLHLCVPHIQTYIFISTISALSRAQAFAKQSAAKASSRIQLRRLPFPVIAASLGHSSTLSDQPALLLLSRHQPCDPPRKSSPAHTIPPCSNNIIFALAHTHISH